MRQSRSRFFGLLVLALVTALLVAGCGSKSSSTSTTGATQGTSSNGSQTTTTQHTRFAKTKFVLHAGLAFGAFHRYIYKPFKAGSFTGGNLGRHKLAVVKAGLAGLFAYHELKLALTDAKSSPLLSKLLTPITALGNELKALGAKLKGGQVDKASIESANTGASALSGLAGSAGQTITETVPGAVQLLKGG